MKPLTLTVFAFALALATCSAVSARPVPAADSAEKSALTFTQKFYDWYLAGNKRLRDTPEAGSMIQKCRSSFSKELMKRLDEDAAASAKRKDEIVGLDFDPVLNAQDFAARYVASHVTHRGKSYFAEVRSISGGKKSARIDVQPELVQSGKTWVFVNFHYPAAGKGEPKSDLLGILKQLRDDRAKNHRYPAALTELGP
jgi:hypothetical protein